MSILLEVIVFLKLGQGAQILSNFGSRLDRKYGLLESIRLVVSMRQRMRLINQE